ncbi:MAG: CPBP family intramembrane metalloprotease [Lachnospiraceae bacterium]|nr:CPBP family intramembrane metalloprotease [Lachnospiraceae bacterium]
MNLFIQTFINSIVEILLFSLIPLIWWLITARKETGFFKWIGLKRPKDTKENKTFIWILAIIICFCVLSAFMLILVKGTQTATSQFEGLRFSALPAILIYAILNTALPEEILFRGFLLKRFSSKFGFTAGNIIQSMLFGLMHGIMFFSVSGMIKAILIILFTGSIGWFMGFVNEKKADGSIIPSWMIHAAANIFSAICSAFLLF